MSAPSSLRLKNPPSNENKLPSSLKLKHSNNQQEQPKPSSKEDSMMESAFRTVMQPALGWLQVQTPAIAASFWQLLGTGEALDESEIDRLEEISQREGVPFDREGYKKAAQHALENIPTVHNLARMVEEKTGIPLNPKNEWQKALQLGTSAGTLTPGSLAQKATAGVTTPAVSQGLQAVGVPEPFAELGGFAAGTGVGRSVNISRTPVTKSSGMPVRKFEKITFPRKVSEGKISKISEALEQDFGKISEEILSKGPLENVKKNMQANPEYKQEVAQRFEQVESLAKELREDIPTKDVSNILKERIKEKTSGGLTLSEYEKDYKTISQEKIKDLGDRSGKPSDYVREYRKTNEELSKAFDPSKSKNYNTAKKDALLDYNRALVEAMEKKYPDSEFIKLFKRQNKDWSEILDYEFVREHVQDIFKDKVDFKQANKIFTKPKYAQKFKRALGSEGFEDFKQLTKDLSSTENSFKMLKKAQSSGYGDLVKTLGNMGIYHLNPKLWMTLGVYKLSTKGKGVLMDFLLENPEYITRIKKGVESFNKGDFVAADLEFAIVKSAIEEQND